MNMNIIRHEISPYFCMHFLNQDWKGSSPHRYEPSKFLTKTVAGEGEQPVVGPGFAWIYPKPEEIVRNLPLCFLGLWIRPLSGPTGPRGKRLQPLVSSCSM